MPAELIMNGEKNLAVAFLRSPDMEMELEDQEDHSSEVDF